MSLLHGHCSIHLGRCWRKTGVLRRKPFPTIRRSNQPLGTTYGHFPFVGPRGMGLRMAPSMEASHRSLDPTNCPLSAPPRVTDAKRAARLPSLCRDEVGRWFLHCFALPPLGQVRYVEVRGTRRRKLSQSVTLNDLDSSRMADSWSASTTMAQFTDVTR